MSTQQIVQNSKIAITNSNAMLEKVNMLQIRETRVHWVLTSSMTSQVLAPITTLLSGEVNYNYKCEEWYDYKGQLYMEGHNWWMNTIFYLMRPMWIWNSIKQTIRK